MGRGGDEPNPQQLVDRIAGGIPAGVAWLEAAFLGDPSGDCVGPRAATAGKVTDKTITQQGRVDDEYQQENQGNAGQVQRNPPGPPRELAATTKCRGVGERIEQQE